jgi:bifunctional DNA-binding transcriptional regulator/antitoxin component of YhaV-PrlF toxin-antitoxin module
MNNNEDLKLHSILDENIGKFGFADEAGNVVIPCKWRDVGEFSEGLALVADDEMNYGYIDKTGKVVIPCKWADAWEFDNGLARVFDVIISLAEYRCSALTIPRGAHREYRS